MCRSSSGTSGSTGTCRSLAEAKYSKVLSPVADPPNQDGFKSGEHPQFQPGCFEIQWDTGALWGPGTAQSAAFETGFKETSIEDNDWPPESFDLWPSTDMWVWAAGRWVYDCSRATKTDPKATGANKKDPQMVAMLNPAKAIATARWRGFKFLQNEFAVPAIQFMFFTTKRGGYLNYDTISDQDYEFILDLPPIDFKPQPFPIAQESKSVHNTIMLRPRLLHKITKGPFAQFAGASGPDPIISVIRRRIPISLRRR